MDLFSGFALTEVNSKQPAKSSLLNRHRRADAHLGIYPTDFKGAMECASPSHIFNAEHKVGSWCFDAFSGLPNSLKNGWQPSRHLKYPEVS